jgi:hypothetical protein
MSTTVEHPAPAAGSRLVEFDEFIDYQLTRTSRGIRSTDLLTGIVGAALGTCAYLLLFILLDHWVVPGGFNVWMRSALWILGAAGLTAWITLRLVRPWRGKVNALFAAKQIERSQPGLKSSLLTLIDLKQAGRTASTAVKTSLEKRTAVGLSKADVDEAIDRKVLMNCSYGLLGVLAVFCGYAVFSPKSIAQSAWRALVPFSDVAAATRTRIDRILPGDVEVPAFSQVPIEVEISGQVPKDVTVLYTSADRKLLDEPLALRDTGEGLRRFRGTLLGEDGRGLRQTLTYRVVAGDARSQEYSVRVVQPPSATMDEVAYQYPKYMGLAEKSETGGAIDGWEGTKVTLKATANMPVASAMALFSDSEDTTVKAEELPLVVTGGTKLAGTWTLSMRSDGTYPKFYRVQVKTDAGHQDPQPALYPVRIRADQPPKIEVLTPKSDLVVAANGTVSVACRAADPDFQLQSVIMHFEREGRELPTLATLFQAPPNQAAFDGVHSIQLSEFNLPVGGRLTWWLEARDNMQPFGDRRGNRSVTPKLNIDIAEPKPPEVAKQEGEEAKKGAEQKLEQAQRENAAGGADEGANASQSPMDDRDDEPMNKEPREDEGAEEKPAKPETASDETLPEDGTAQESGDSEKTREERPMKPDESGREDEKTEPGEKTGTEKKTPGQASEAPAEPKEPGAQEKSVTKKPGDRGQGGDKGRGEKGTPQQKSDGRKQGGSDEQKADDSLTQKLVNWANKQEKEQKDRGQEGPPDGSHDAAKPPEKDPGQSPEQPSADSERPSKEGRDQAGQRTKPEERSEKGVKPPMKDAPGSKPKPPEGESSKGEDREETPGSKASPSEGGTGERQPAGEKPTKPEEEPGSPSSPMAERAPQDDATGEKGADGSKPKGADGEKPGQPKGGSKDPMTGEKGTTPQTGGEQPKPAEGDQPSADGSKPMPNPDGAKPGDNNQNDSGSRDATGQPKGAEPPKVGDKGSENPAADGAPMKDDAGNEGKPGEQTEPKPGEENATAPDTKPMTGGESPREPKTPSKERQNESADGGEDPTKPKGPASDSAKPSAAEKPSESESNQPADSQESTSGSADSRKQNSSPQSKSNENKGTGEKQPTGQADEGARSGGEGNPGSSSAGESGDQTEQGPGEPGKNGGKDSSSGKGSKGNSGAKGAGKGSSGEKGGESGDKPSESGAGESSSSGSGTKDSDSDSKDGSKGSQSGSKGEPGGKGTASGEKDAPKQSGGKSESGSENGTPADEPARPDQKPTKTGTGKNGTPTKEDAPEGGAPSSDEQSGGGGEKSKGGAKPNADKGGEKESGAGGEEKGGDQKGGSQKDGGDQQGGGKGQGKGGGQGEGAGKGGSKGQSNQSGAGGKGGTKAASGLGGPGQSGDAPPDPGPASEAVDDTAPHADEADLENRKKAVNLALKKLKETLERGSDQAVGEDLDVSDKELADFMRRLEERLADTGEDNSAEAQARRRQFDSILQSLKINGDSEDRKGDGSGSAASGFAAPRRPAPPEYRKAETQYKQRLSNQRRGAK